jgi:antitoxin VapB
MNKHGKIEKPKQLNLKDGETYELAAELAKLRGDSLSGAVKSALREAVAREQRGLTKEERFERLMALSRQSAALIGPRTMTDDEAVGYGEFGEPI